VAAHRQLVGWHGQSQVREPAGQFGQREAQLYPGQRLASALVDAEAEGKVLPRALHAVSGDAVSGLVSGAAAGASPPILIDTRFPGATLRITPVEDGPSTGGVRGLGRLFAGGARVDGTVPRAEGAGQAGSFVVLDDTAGVVL